MNVKKILILIFLSIVSVTSADPYESYYWIQGTALNNNQPLRDSSFDLYMCKSAQCRTAVRTDKQGQFKTMIKIIGLCSFGNPCPYSDIECYLKHSKRLNPDTLVFFYNGSAFKIENEAIRLMRDQRAENKNPTDFIKTVSIKFNAN